MIEGTADEAIRIRAIADENRRTPYFLSSIERRSSPDKNRIAATSANAIKVLFGELI
jgi:hypothetical protein